MPKNIEYLIEATNVLSPEINMVYDRCFNATNWWNKPNDERSDGNVYMRASKFGRGLLELYTRLNGGMLRLGGPTEAENPLRAVDHPKGTIVKATFESFEHSNRLLKTTDGYLATVTEFNNGYMITRFFENGFASYSQYVTWLASTETVNQGLAFFPLDVNSAESFNAGLSDKYSPALRVVGSLPKDGRKQMVIKKPSVEINIISTKYLRVGAAAVYQPIETPRFKY